MRSRVSKWRCSISAPWHAAQPICQGAGHFEPSILAGPLCRSTISHSFDQPKPSISGRQALCRAAGERRYVRSGRSGSSRAGTAHQDHGRGGAAVPGRGGAPCRRRSPEVPAAPQHWRGEGLSSVFGDALSMVDEAGARWQARCGYVPCARLVWSPLALLSLCSGGRNAVVFACLRAMQQRALPRRSLNGVPTPAAVAARLALPGSSAYPLDPRVCRPMSSSTP